MEGGRKGWRLEVGGTGVLTAVSQAHDQLLRLEERARIDEAERARVFGKRLEAVQASRDYLALQSEQQARRGPGHRAPSGHPSPTPTDASALTPTASPSARSPRILHYPLLQPPAPSYPGFGHCSHPALPEGILPRTDRPSSCATCARPSLRARPSSSASCGRRPSSGALNTQLQKPGSSRGIA